MTFEEADHRYQALRRQWEAGQVSQAQFVEAVNALRVQTTDGTWWQIRGMDGSWLRWNGAAWEQALPPQRTHPLDPQQPRSNQAASSPPTQPLSTPPVSRPQPFQPPRPAPAPPIPIPQPTVLTQQAVSKRPFPILWAAVGCFGCILMALVGGLGAAYFGLLPLPGVARSQDSSPVPTLPSGFSPTDPPGVPTTVDETITASPTDPFAAEPTQAASATDSIDSEPTPAGPMPDLSNSPRALAILNQGVIRIAAHNIGVPPLSIRNGDTYTGFEAELALEIVSRVFGEGVAIEWVPVTAQDRFALIQSGDVDLLIRNVSHTTSREQFGYFTDNYFLDGLRLLVKADSSIYQLADLDGQVIAMEGGTQSELELGSKIADSGLDIDILPMSTLEEAIALLDNGDAQAVAGFWIRLESMLQDGSNYRVTGPLISIEPYGIMLPLDDPQFRDHINTVLSETILDSTWYFIFPNWFEGEVPFSEEQLLETPPLGR